MNEKRGKKNYIENIYHEFCSCKECAINEKIFISLFRILYHLEHYGCRYIAVFVWLWSQDELSDTMKIRGKRFGWVAKQG